MIGALRNLRWWVLDYAYAGYWQARAALGRTPSDRFRDGDRAPIVVIPGVYETWRFLEPLIRWLHDAGHPVHVLDFARFNTRPVVEGAQQVADHLIANDLRRVTIVAHSKGGLIGKYAMSMPAVADRVEAMLAIATPFSGSAYARFALLPSIRMFSPVDRTILELAQQARLNARIVSVYGRFDPHIPGGSELAGARNVELDAGGHFRVLADPRVFAELKRLLDRA